MPRSSFLRFACRMALREAKSSPFKFALATLSMTVAVAGVFGIRSVSAGFASHITDNSRQWIAADVMAVYLGPAPTDEQLETVRRDAGEGNFTIVTDTQAMAASDQSADPLLVSIKAFDPTLYPFYGRLELKSGEAVRPELDGDSVVVDDDLLDSLQVHVGDSIRVHGISFRIRDVIATEPDRFAIPPAPQSRVLMSQSGLERTGLVRFGSAFYRVLVRIPSSANRLAFCSRLERLFPDADVVDFTTPTPQMSAMVEWVAPFLNVLALLSLTFGAVGIAVAAYFHLLRRMDTIAILKSVGATTSQVLTIYFLQVLILSLVSWAMGIAGGRVIGLVVNYFAARYFSARLATEASIGLIGETGILCVLSALVAAWVPLSRIRTIPASVLLRRDAGEKSALARGIGVRAQLPRLALAIAGATMALLLFRMVDSWRVRALFVAGSVAGLAGLYALAQLTVSTFIRTADALPWRMPFVLRHGITNLHRYRRQSRVVMVAFAGGVALMFISVLGQWQLGGRVMGAIPFGAPNLLFLGLQASERRDVLTTLRDQPGITSPPEFISSAWLTLEQAGGSTLDKLREHEGGLWIQKSWPVSCLASWPDTLPLVEGRWASDESGTNAVAVDQELAKRLGIGVGSDLDFRSATGPLHGRVAALVRLSPTQQLWWHQIFFNCETLPGASYNGGVAVDPRVLTQVRNSLRTRFPEMNVMEAGDLMRRVQKLGMEAIWTMRWIAVLIACAAGCLLLAVTNSLRAFRVHEIAILRAVGARRGTLLAIFSAEYLALGGLAGLMGALLGCGAASVILRQLIGQFVWTFNLTGIVMSTIAAAVLAMIVGVLGSLPLLRLRPLEVLRKS